MGCPTAMCSMWVIPPMISKSMHIHPKLVGNLKADRCLPPNGKVRLRLRLANLPLPLTSLPQPSDTMGA